MKQNGEGGGCCPCIYFSVDIHHLDTKFCFSELLNCLAVLRLPADPLQTLNEMEYLQICKILEENHEGFWEWIAMFVLWIHC